jgi:CO/xanthine dehydrogenase Mo-binding subunit
MARKTVKTKLIMEGDFVETTAEVPTEKHEGWPANDKLKIVGKEISRIDGYDKVSGSAVYTSDVILPKMVFAKTLRCPLPHATIKKINTFKAENLPGVLKIITHENTAEIPWYYATSLLFDPHLRYIGDEVACVAATTTKIADHALKLIEVEYEELPFVVNVTKAMENKAPKLHGSNNLVRGEPSVYQRGDVEKGFTEADIIVEDTFTTQVAIHNPAEVHCSVVKWNGDKLTIWDSTQAVFVVQDAIAQSLKISPGSIRVIKKYMGGGFGSKLEAGKYTVIAALLAKELGRPVKILLDRKEMNLAVGNRPNSVQKLKVGAKKDGTLTAMSHYSYGAVGAYPTGAGCSWPFRSVYKCPNVRSEEYSVYINAGRARAFRAPGHVQGTFALDSIMDDFAEKLNMDPLDFRLKNYTEIDQVSNEPYTSKLLKEAYQKGAEAIGWYTKRKSAGSDKGPIKHGIGMATQIWWGGGGPPAHATLKLFWDRSLNVCSGTQDLGTGTYTILAQVASEVLEIPLEKISVTIGDTEVCPYAPLSGGSMTAASVTPAVRDAAEQMKDKLIFGASSILEVPQSQLRYSNGMVSNKQDASKKVSIEDIFTKINENDLITTGARGANPENKAINSFGAYFAEVEVDIETGKIRVIKMVAAQDVGRVINQKTLENQIHGGIMQGIGFALMEERIIDEFTGKVLTTDLHSYKLPTIADAPEIEVIIVSEGDPLISNTGVKGVGEPPIIATPAAIANAVNNAIGVRVKDLPMTPDRVLMALQNAKVKS